MIAPPASLALVSFVFVSTAISAIAGNVDSRPGLKPFGSKKCSSTRHNVNFDDRDWVPGVYVTNTIGTHQELAWHGFDGFNANLTTTTATSLAPFTLESYPNAIAAGFEATLLSRQVPTITTVYSNSPSAGGFNLHSFYFSCVENLGQELTAFGTTCDFVVQAFKNGHKVSEKKLSYDPKNVVRSGMSLAKLDSPAFCNIDTVKFVVPKEITKALVIDNVDYTTHTCKKAGSKRGLTKEQYQLLHGTGELGTAVQKDSKSLTLNGKRIVDGKGPRL